MTDVESLKRELLDAVAAADSAEADTARVKAWAPYGLK